MSSQQPGNHNNGRAHLAADVEWQERMRMGQIAFTQGKYREATEQFQKAVKRAEEFGKNDSRTSVSLLNLAMSYGASGRDDLADPFFREALSIDERTLPAKSREIAIDLIDVGAHYARMSKQGQAEQMYKRAIDILEKDDSLTNDLALALNNLGLLYLQEGEPARAEAPLKKALNIREQRFSNTSKEVAESLVNLATLYSRTDRTDEARELYERAILILEMQLGPDHPELADVLEDYADMLRSLREEEQAEELEERAHKILRAHDT